MAENKKSFVLYSDYVTTFSHLTTEEKGKLLELIFDYVNDKNPVCEDRIVKIAFEPIKQQLKRDLRAWENIRQKRSDAGRASANKRQQVSTSVESVEQKQQVSTVTVNVNDTVTVNDNVINIKERKQKFASTLEPFLDMYGREMLNEFYKYWSEHGEKDKKFRREKERSWDLKRRLETWKSNESKFNKNGKSEKYAANNAELDQLSEIARQQLNGSLNP